MIDLEICGVGGWKFVCDECGKVFGQYDLQHEGIEAARKAGWRWNARKNKLLCPKHPRTRTSQFEMKLIKLGWIEKE